MPYVNVFLQNFVAHAPLWPPGLALAASGTRRTRVPVPLCYDKVIKCSNLPNEFHPHFPQICCPSPCCSSPLSRFLTWESWASETLHSMHDIKKVSTFVLASETNDVSWKTKKSIT